MFYKITIIIFILFTINIKTQGQIGIADTFYIQTLMDSIDNTPTSKTTFELSKRVAYLSQQINYNEGIAHALLNTVCYYEEHNDYTKAIQYGQELAKFAAAIHDNVYLVLAYVSLSRSYLSLELTKQADKYLEKVLEISRTTEDTSELAAIYSDIGLYYVERQCFKKAIQYLNEGKELAKQVDSIDFFPIDNYNLGIAYLNTGQVESAIPYFLDLIKYIQQEKDSLSFANAFNNLACAYRETKEYDKMFAYFDSSLYYSNLYNQLENTYHVYYEMSYAYSDLENCESALFYFEEYSYLRDSVVNFENKQYVNELKIKFDAEQHEKALGLFQQEANKLKSEKQYIGLLVGGLFSVMTIILLFLLKTHSDTKRKLQLYEIEKEKTSLNLKNKALETQKLKDELGGKKKDLTNLAIDITRRNVFFEKLLERLNGLTSSKNAIDVVEIQKIINYLNSGLKGKEELNVLHKNIDEINQAFYQKLDERFEKLSVNDKYVLGLIRLNLSNKEIASIKSISPSSAKVLRYRLRKKLQLSSDVDIVKFLQEF